MDAKYLTAVRRTRSFPGPFIFLTTTELKAHQRSFDGLVTNRSSTGVLMPRYLTEEHGSIPSSLDPHSVSSGSPHNRTHRMANSRIQTILCESSRQRGHIDLRCRVNPTRAPLYGD